MKISGDELEDYMNRNNFIPSHGSEYQGGRGTYSLIRETWKWVENYIRLPNEARKIAEAFVKPDGSFVYE